MNRLYSSVVCVIINFETFVAIASAQARALHALHLSAVTERRHEHLWSFLSIFRGDTSRHEMNNKHDTWQGVWRWSLLLIT